MKRIVTIEAMVVIALLAGALTVYGYTSFEGVHATYVVISGEGEGEGEPPENSIVFKDPVSYIDFQGEYSGMHSEYRANVLLDYGQMQSSGSDPFWDPDSTTWIAPVTDIFGDVSDNYDDYAWLTVASGMTVLLGNTGLIMAGRLTQSADEGEGEGEEQVYTGAYLIGQGEDDEPGSAMVHASPYGGLDRDVGTGPIAEMTTFVPGSGFFPMKTACLALQGNDTDGQIVLQNYHQDTENSPNASITVSPSGSVIVQLGSSGTTQSSSQSAMAASYTESAVSQCPPAQSTTPVPRLTLQSIKEAIANSW